MTLTRSFLVFALLAVVTASKTLDEAVRTALSHFQDQCAKQQALMPELLRATEYKDLSRAIKAYTAARPPYEQIETLANVFPDLDEAIDARPYVFGTGEDDENFVGFHRLERDFYRDQDLTHSYETAVNLNHTINTLCDVLSEVDKFSPGAIWTGVMALVYEVPAKKISSEEETWSDLSLMIFRNNFQGLWSQASPFFETGMASEESIEVAKKHHATIVTIMNEIDPMHDFYTAAGDARPYSNVSIPERKRILDAAYNLGAALSVVHEQIIPEQEEEEEEEEEEEAGLGLDAERYAAETAQGVAYFYEKCKEQLHLLEGLESAVASGDIHRARQAYAVARPPYEQIETIAPSFPDLDKAIDARPYAYGTGEADEEWKGFHKVERELYRDNDLEAAGESLKVVRGSVEELCRTLSESGPTFTAENTWEGLIALAYEVPAKKISSEEETWSDLSVMIYRENVLGIQSQVKPFLPRMPVRVAAEIVSAYEHALGFLLYVVDSGNGINGTNFRAYSDLHVWERKGISDSFYVYGRALIKGYDSLIDGQG